MTDIRKKPIVINEEKVVGIIVDLFGLTAMLGNKAHEKDDDRREDLGNLLTIMSSLLMHELKVNPETLARVTDERTEMLSELFKLVDDSPENVEDFKRFIKNNPLN